MITIQYKLYPNKNQREFLDGNLWCSIGIYNWTVGQIQNTYDGIIPFPLFFMSGLQLRSILSKRIKGHAGTCGLSSALINHTIQHAIKSHIRNKKIGTRTKFQSVRKTRSFQFNGDIKFDKKLRIKIPGLKTTIKTHKEMPPSRPKMMVFIKKFNGWYCSVTFDSNRNKIKVIGSNEVGIDPGLSTSLTLSNGIEYQFPRPYLDNQDLIKKLQRKSPNSKRLKYLHNKLRNQRKDHHHKLTTKLVAENKLICWSNDNFSKLKQVLKFGKKYSDLALGQIALFIESKMASRSDDLGIFKRVSSKNSTMTCSSCGAQSGPKGKVGLSVRNWRCNVCTIEHDRDINAAMNTLILGKGVPSVNEIVNS